MNAGAPRHPAPGAAAGRETPTPERAGTRWAPMLWSQEHYWFLYFDVPAYGAIRDCVKISRSWRFDSDVPDAAVLAALTALVARYESLRSNFLLDDAGTPVQAVRPPWPVTFDLRLRASAADLPAVTERLGARPFDPARDRPVRFALIAGDAGDSWVLMTAIHCVIDGQSWIALENAFRSLLAAGHDDVPLPETRQPREQAELDHSPERARYRERVRAYWRDRYRSIPQGMFPDYRPAPVGHFAGFTPPSPYERVTLTSRRLVHAAERVAAERGIGPGVVYLKALGTVLSALSGNDRCVVSMDTANRADPMLSSAVGCFFQPALVVFDVAAQDTAASLLNKVFSATVMAQRYARYSSLEMTEERARAGHERGMNLRIGVTYNYFARRSPGAGAPAPDGTGDGGSATDDFVVEKAPIDWQDNSADLYFAVEAGEDGVTLSMHGHVSVTDADRIGQALRGIGALIAGWADGTLPMDLPLDRAQAELALPRRRFGPGWVHVDHAWADTRACTALLARLPGVVGAAVLTEGTDDGGTRLVAYVAGDTTPERLRHGLSAALVTHPCLVLPHRFVVCADAPEHSTPRAWATALVTAEGDGFPSRPVPAHTPGERALATALAARCPALTVDMATPYLPAGGRAALAPSVVDHLEDAGFTGVIPADLLGPLPLGAVAAKLSPTPEARK
ncbi:condensation domain-containing protein [Streptomyces olivaceoviridis]